MYIHTCSQTHLHTHTHTSQVLECYIALVVVFLFHQLARSNAWDVGHHHHHPHASSATECLNIPNKAPSIHPPFAFLRTRSHHWVVFFAFKVAFIFAFPSWLLNLKSSLDLISWSHWFYIRCCCGCSSCFNYSNTKCNCLTFSGLHEGRARHTLWCV